MSGYCPSLVDLIICATGIIVRNAYVFDSYSYISIGAINMKFGAKASDVRIKNV
jgi:hypothetical protein